MKNNRYIAYSVVGAALLVGGCQQQYLERHDGVTTHAGNHLAVNEAKMVVDPWNRDAYNNNIEGDGKRLGMQSSATGIPTVRNPATDNKQFCCQRCLRAKPSNSVISGETDGQGRTEK